MIYVLKVAYDGSEFQGVQRQPGKPTVLGHLETLASQILGEEIRMGAAGRTDTGVHATGQVIAFQSHRSCRAEQLTHGINAMARLPLAVLETAVLGDETGFHPRHSALRRTYNYLLVDDCCYTQRLFWNGRAWTMGGALDPEAIRAAGEHLLGEHDLSTFCYQPDEDMARVRTVTRVSFEEEPLPPFFSASTGKGRMWRLEITANGFLRRMVRTLASALVRVGLALDTPESFAEKLRAADPKQGPPPAPPYGLYFKAVTYDPDPFEIGRQGGRYHKANPSQRLSFRDHLRDPISG